MTTPTAHPNLADLAASLGYTRRTDTFWEARSANGHSEAWLVVADAYEVYAFAGTEGGLWSARLTLSTPPAALAAVMAVAAAEAQR